MTALISPRHAWLPLSALAVVSLSLAWAIADKHVPSPLGSHTTAASLPSQVVTNDAGPDDTMVASRRSALAPAPSVLNVYAATMTDGFSPNVAGFPERVYVPNSASNTVDVIDPATYRVVAQYWVGILPHHIAPSWDLSQLYVDDTASGLLTVIDPRTSLPVSRIAVPDPYNLYFTPDGTKAIVVAEGFRRLDFRDPHTWRLIKSVRIPWSGVDHLDFSADGSYLLASTEYAGVLVRVDVASMQITGTIRVGGLPIDVRLAPDGTVFYVANQGRNGVSIVDAVAMKEIGFLPTGRGAHGLYVSRDTESLYVTNRLAGSISVIDLASRTVAATWRIGGTPDMIQLSPDGRQLWTTGRYDGFVYVVDTSSGQLLHRIRVGGQPHGLTYFPNVGRFSIGHNGIYR